MPPIAFWRACVFWKGIFFNHRLWVWLWAQNKLTYCECHTSSFGYWTEKLKWIIKCWDNTLIIPRIRFACWKGKGVTDSLMTTQSVAPSVWQYPFTSLGEREQSHKFSWLWMLSPRERWVESQPRGTFPMLKVLHSWEHCFPGNNTFTHRAPFRCETAVNCEVYISHTEDVYALHYCVISQPNMNDPPPSFSVLKGNEDFLLDNSIFWIINITKQSCQHLPESPLGDFLNWS